jgi:hypothetical protein
MTFTLILLAIVVVATLLRYAWVWMVLLALGALAALIAWPLQTIALVVVGWAAITVWGALRNA